MKTIKYYRQHGGHIERLEDTEALKEVQLGKAMWAPKRWVKWAAIKKEKDDG